MLVQIKLLPNVPTINDYNAKKKKKKKSTSRKANHRVFYNLLLFSAPLLAMDAAFITVKGYRNEFHV